MEETLIFQRTETDRFSSISIKDATNFLQKFYYYEPLEDVSLLIKQVLLTQQFHPVGFKDSEEFYNQCVKTPPPIAFVSMTSEGKELIQRLKNNDRTQDTFLIAGDVYKKSKEIAYSLGADLYIPKPYIYRILSYIVHSIIFIMDLEIHSESYKNRLHDIKLNFDVAGNTLVEIFF